MSGEVEIVGLEELQRDLLRMSEELHGKPMVDEMQKATLLVTGDARRFAPVDTGRLRASITPEVRPSGNTVEGVVYSNVEYAPYMEFGTSHTRMPPPSALEVWARRHGFPNGYVVALAILRAGGLKPRKFFERAFEANRGKIADMIGNVVGRIIRG